MGSADDIEKDEKEQHLLETGRAAAISRQLHANILPIFLVMSALCYLDRCGLFWCVQPTTCRWLLAV